MKEILKCCGETPEITDHTYDFSYSGEFIPLWRYTFACVKCGHHIHSKEKSWEDVIPIWNRAMRRIL